jgi:hypothetical protein
MQSVKRQIKEVEVEYSGSSRSLIGLVNASDSARHAAHFILSDLSNLVYHEIQIPLKRWIENWNE